MLKSLAESLAHAHVNWTPEKHPRGHDGKFIEIGDKVKVFSGPGQELSVGTVKAGHLAPDGRMFIGVEDEHGNLGWYRPKQLEQINAKATLTPTKPLPDVGHKASDIQWEEDQAKPIEPGVPITSVDQLDAAPVGSKMSYKSGLGLDTYTKNENGDWMTDSASPYPSSDFEGPIDAGYMVGYTPPKQLYEGDHVDSYVDMDALPVGTQIQVQMGGTDYHYTKTAQKGTWQDDDGTTFHTIDFFKTDGSAKSSGMGVTKVGDGTFDGKKSMSAQDVHDADQGSIVTNFGTSWTKITDDEWESEDGTSSVSTDEMAQEAAKGHVIMSLEHHLDDGYDGFDLNEPPLTGPQLSAMPPGAMVYMGGENGMQLVKGADGTWTDIEDDSGSTYDLESYVNAGVDIHAMSNGEEPQLEDPSTAPLEDWEKELLAPMHVPPGPPDPGLHAGESPQNVDELDALPVGTEIKSGSSPYIKVANGGAEAWLYTNSYPDEPKYLASSKTLFGQNGDVLIKVQKIGDGTLTSDAPLSLSQLYSLPLGAKIDWTEPGGEVAVFQKIGDDAWSIVHDDGSIGTDPTSGSKTAVFKSVAAEGKVTLHAEEPLLEANTDSWPTDHLKLGDTVPSEDQLDQLPDGAVIKAGYQSDSTFIKTNGKWIDSDYAGGNGYDSNDLFDPSSGEPWNTITVVGMPSALKVPIAPPTPPLKLPAGKTPADLLAMIHTTALNKNLSTGMSDHVLSHLAKAMNLDTPTAVAHKHLAVAMTAAKLGGKQRARYKQLLSMHRGETPTGTTSAPKPGAPTMAVQAQLLPNGLPAINGMVKPQGASVTPLSKANSMTQSGGETPQQAKSAIQLTMVHKIAHIPTEQIAALADSPTYKGNDTYKQMVTAWRVMQKKQSGKALTAAEQNTLNTWTSGNFVLTKSSGHWQFTNAKGYHSNSKPVDFASLDMAVRETAVASMIQLWAATSNDQNPRSLAMQIAADREFNLQGAAKWDPPGYNATSTEKANKEADDEYARYGTTVFQPFLRGMYENTQEWLKAHGVTHVVLRRGMTGVKGFYKGDTGQVALRPLNSFSSNLAVAKRFGGGSGPVLEAVIPAERIIGGSSTGFGCRGEYEYVVLGGTDLYRRYR